MSQLQPVFFTMSTERKAKFLLETRIWNKNGKLFAEKRASVTEAAAHLERMLTNYQVLSKMKKMSSLVSIVPAVKSGQTVRFNYIAGTSAERVLLEKILSEDAKGTYAVIDKLFAIIDSLPSARTNPTKSPQYRAVFGNAFNKTLDCIKPGIVDLNLNNFIVDEAGQWHLYDYEWLFDFPVPKKLLRMRFMFYFLNRHREILCYHAQKIASLTVGNVLYIPKFIYERYEKELAGLEELKKAETSFQLYVSDFPGQRFAKIKENGFAVQEAATPVLGIEAVIRRSIRQEVDPVKAELKAEHDRRLSFERKLSAITSSRSYKLAKKMGSAKRRLLGS